MEGEAVEAKEQRRTPSLGLLPEAITSAGLTDGPVRALAHGWVIPSPVIDTIF